MRIRVPGRWLATLAILVTFLCLLPTSTRVAVARPIGWEDVGPPTPPSGDNDGVVLKGKGAAAFPTAPTTGTGSVAPRSTVSYDRVGLLMRVLAALRAHYWLLWTR